MVLTARRWPATRLRLFLSLAVGGLLLSSCGGGASGAPAAAPKPTPARATTASLQSHVCSLATSDEINRAVHGLAVKQATDYPRGTATDPDAAYCDYEPSGTVQIFVISGSEGKAKFDKDKANLPPATSPTPPSDGVTPAGLPIIYAPQIADTPRVEFQYGKQTTIIIFENSRDFASENLTNLFALIYPRLAAHPEL